MKKAYLILAHDQPGLLARLIDRLLDKDVHVFIHIDRRVDVQSFCLSIDNLKNKLKNTNVHFAKERIRINWMGFSVVEATLSLMRQASDFSKFSYFSLLSGTDYPIKSNSYIADFFCENNTEYMSYWMLKDRPSWLHKVEHYFFIDSIPLRSQKNSAPYLYWHMFFRLRNIFPKRSYPFPHLEPYGGSQWWSLTDNCVRYILNYVDKHPNFVKFYKYTHSPDEMFFQTIVMNSKYSEKVVRYASYKKWSSETPHDDKLDELRMLTEFPEETSNFRYIDWSGTITGQRDIPAVLDERDFNDICETECLFARKLDIQRSIKLLDLIDTAILKEAIQ